MKTPDNYTAKVGILLATYNQGAYMDDAIASLKNQTFQDFIVLAVDDASTDTTPEALKKVTYDKVVKKIFLNKNVGIGNVVRKYLPLLDAEFLFVFCADDMLDPTYIEQCLHFLENNPKHGAVATWIENFGARTDIMTHITEERIRLPEMLFENSFLGSSLVRRVAMEQIGFGNKGQDFQKHNDYDRWVSILENGWKLGVIKQPLFKYRRLHTSLSSSINVADELAFQKVFIKKHLSLFRKYADKISLFHIERFLNDKVWVQELKEGRDWLTAEYERLSKENDELRAQQGQNLLKKIAKRLSSPLSRNKR